MPELAPGDVVWVAPDAAVGREQAGRRPALVVCGSDYLQLIDSLAVVVPITSIDRGWPNHVPVTGAALTSPSWAMTEQVRTISRERIVGTAGRADAATLRAVRGWIRDLLDVN
jgi:mRNA interferase MazF